MIMPGIELSVIPRIDISTRVTVVTDGKAGVASVMTRTTRGWKGAEGGMFQGVGIIGAEPGDT